VLDTMMKGGLPDALSGSKVGSSEKSLKSKPHQKRKEKASNRAPTMARLSERESSRGESTRRRGQLFRALCDRLAAKGRDRQNRRGKLDLLKRISLKKVVTAEKTPTQSKS